MAEERKEKRDEQDQQRREERRDERNEQKEERRGEQRGERREQGAGHSNSVNKVVQAVRHLLIRNAHRPFLFRTPDELGCNRFLPPAP